MPQINTDAIVNKAKTYMRSPAAQKRIEQKIDSAVMTGGSVSDANGKTITMTGAREAAEKFIEVLQNEIKSLGAGSGYADGRLGGTAVASLTQLKHGGIRKTGKNKYQIEVWFADDLHRESLVPDRYDGVENIAALLNKGYHARNTVYGTWHGKDVASLQQRDGSHFIEHAIDTFMVNYASTYGVTAIEAADIYQ